MNNLESKNDSSIVITKYDFSKVGKLDNLAGRHVRLEGDSVHLDTGVGKFLRKVIGNFIGNKPVYVNDLKTKIEILNDATVFKGKSKIDNIANILTKDIVRDRNFNNSSTGNTTSLNEDSLGKVIHEQTMLYEKIVKRNDPLIKVLIDNHMKNIEGTEDFDYGKALKYLDKQGVDLKTGGIDIDRFVQNLVDIKYEQLRGKCISLNSHSTDIKAIIPEKDTLKTLIRKNYNEIRSLESSIPRKDGNDIDYHSNFFINKNYEHLIKVKEGDNFVNYVPDKNTIK